MELREALTKAFEEEDKNEENKDGTPTPQELMDDNGKRTEDSGSLESARNASDDGQKTGSGEAEAKDTDLENKDSEGEKRAVSEDADKHDKAPAGWSPKARQAWATLPAEIRAEVSKRERDFAVGIQRNSETAKFGDAVQRVLAPFQAVMRMEGANELQAIESLAQTAATLRMGTPVQKANLIRDLIQVYAVDIPTLDEVLSGSQVSDEDHKVAKLLDEKLKPFQNLLQTLEQGRHDYARSTVSTVDKEIATFESQAEFINDVRDDMADLLELAARRGQKLTLQEAYDRAVYARPDLREIVEKRKATDRLKKEHEKMQEKRKAAASLPAGTGGAPVPKTPSTLREQLAQAWDAAAG